MRKVVDYQVYTKSSRVLDDIIWDTIITYDDGTTKFYSKKQKYQGFRSSKTEEVVMIVIYPNNVAKVRSFALGKNKNAKELLYILSSNTCIVHNNDWVEHGACIGYHWDFRTKYERPIEIERNYKILGKGVEKSEYIIFKEYENE